MIAAIIELWKVDNCSRYFKQNGNAGSSSANRVDMIVSGGAIATNSFGAAPRMATGTKRSIWQPLATPPWSWTPWTISWSPACPLATRPIPTAPLTLNPADCGFRGAYITGPVTSDPWATATWPTWLSWARSELAIWAPQSLPVSISMTCSCSAQAPTASS